MFKTQWNTKFFNPERFIRRKGKQGSGGGRPDRLNREDTTQASSPAQMAAAADARMAILKAQGVLE